MRIPIQISVERHGTFSTDTTELDYAIEYYSLADLVQLQAVMVDINFGQADYSDVDSRIALLIMICDAGGFMPRRVLNKRQARTVVSNTRRMFRNLDISESA